ncbi:UbiA family prenyltransferase [Candidatus Thiodiazotropha sp. CDECU1]|uniref:UbiA family prenyltransferase n=1 Tax=Candidatus Thiodiazotropha sp. CDECU1 TaxID=3065865 RepID=UPI00292FCFA9|nr:UbiA family prenyltransferase [Candidatus Thiodiazotropha sp. CDECU1]
MTTTNKKPLVVDLDGTLIQTDLLIESVLALIKHNLLYVFLLPIWLLKGKAKLKQEIASRVDIDASLLPYQDKFLEYLKAEHANGRRLILATASNEKFAHSIAHHLGIFADVLASDDQTNLSGQHKLEGLQRALGNQDFVYAANAMVDLRVWEGADSAVLVNPEPGVIEAVQDHVENPLVFETPDLNSVKNYIKALRFHQWLKNFLIFIPLLMAHKFYDLQLLSQVFVGFIAFGLCASSVYLLNDLLDLADDRQHPTKRHRPFAAGTISILKGTLLIPVLLIAAFGLSLLLPLEFTGVLALYYAITIAYSLYLKRFAPIDILTLAGLYTIRVIAGAAAVSIMPSFWLLAFSMFVFLSLALVKRFTELLKLQHQHQTTTRGRGYSTIDLHTLAQFGSASAYTAVLVLALYINSDDVTKLYSHPELIWMLCPLVLYLMTRIWLLVHRGELDEDPVVFVIRDRHSLWLVVIGAVLLWLAI